MASGWTYPFLLIGGALRQVTFRAVLDLAALGVVLTGAAILAVTGPLAMPTPDPSRERTDPTLVEVGTTPIRLSDVRAQAVMSPQTTPDDIVSADLFETGLLHEAADQVALAKRAEAAGLDKALEIRAELALARRRILSSALLDLAVARATSDEAVRASYDRMAIAAAEDQIVHLRRILVSSEAEAAKIADRIKRGVSFSDMARRQSLDPDTRDTGGQLDPLRISALPVVFRDAVESLPVGAVSRPIAGERGWYLVKVEMRSAVRLPSFAEMRDDIEAAIRADVVATTIADARASVPIRVASLDGATVGAAAPGPQDDATRLRALGSFPARIW